MNELIRIAMRHEKTLTRWSMQLCKDWAKQRKINKWLTRGFIASMMAFVYEDWNLYKTDMKVKELEKKVNDISNNDEKCDIPDKE